MAHSGDGVPLSVALAAAKGQVSEMARDAMLGIAFFALLCLALSVIIVVASWWALLVFVVLLLGAALLSFVRIRRLRRKA